MAAIPLAKMAASLGFLPNRQPGLGGSEIWRVEAAVDVAGLDPPPSLRTVRFSSKNLFPSAAFANTNVDVS